MKLTFMPASNEEVLRSATEKYRNIWSVDGERIISTIQKFTNLTFKDTELKVTVLEEASQSHPMKLRASYDDITKRATLVHELCHRISADYKLPLPVKDEDLALALHKQIYLVLYDLWVVLFGEEVAERQVALESSRNQMYADAWKWTLELTAQERAQRFKALVDQL